MDTILSICAYFYIYFCANSINLFDDFLNGYVKQSSERIDGTINGMIHAQQFR